MGYERPAGRGVGTRNCIIILSTNSQTGTTVSSSSQCTGLKLRATTNRELLSTAC